MSTLQQVTYSLDFDARRKSRNVKPATTEHRGPDVGCVPRIARLLALAIRMEGLVRERAIRVLFFRFKRPLKMALVDNPLLQLTGPQQHLWNDFESLFPTEDELITAAVALGANEVAPWS